LHTGQVVTQILWERNVVDYTLYEPLRLMNCQPEGIFDQIAVFALRLLLNE
jgi:hypothetical protein